MAKITVEYNSFEEMKEAARLILGITDANRGKTEAIQTTQQVSVSAPVVAAAVAQAPVTPAVPVAPTMTAPVAQAPVTPTAAVPTAPTATAQGAVVPTSDRQYTLDELARAGMTLMNAGKQADLQGLLAKFGVEVLPALPREQYGAFAMALREMGAQI